MLSALFAYLAFQIQLIPSHAAFATLRSAAGKSSLCSKDKKNMAELLT